MTQRQDMSGHPSVVPFQFFATADGHVAIATPKEKFFRVLVEGMGLPELASDPRFGDFEARGTHRDALLTLLSARFAERPTAHWMGVLRGKIPIAPVRSMEEALDPDDLRERGMLAEYTHPSFGTVRSVGVPLTLGGHDPTYSRGPGLGADSDAILERLGMTADEIASAREGGAFGTGAPRGSTKDAG